ncbi:MULTISPECIES: DUF5067 domain-containing protein [unclassified Enterococcus]|uniref:DUF5067 domain-containing protein n=1 Tax=unclassified Enterococcus TaxID=2608891 RepID=UPI001CE0B744|nr:MULTISPECIES: DUF5067 domain-containing protein [unclassified Enterococcus]MCA5012188.1 DUF5067 domain-containing protein [Enterococcus sp. S23]MCA5015439.1 DUF5067 domain-containing protein [Enterococcus sp. S22(2020)]
MKRKIMMLLGLLLVFTGCTTKLSEEKQTFSDRGITYSLQLPSSWEKESESQDKYGQNAVFAAKDKKSNSVMFISTTRKDALDLKDFGAKTRKQVAKTYGYDDPEDVYMKEFKLNDHPAYKYTVFTRFKDKDVWAHIYYVETKNGFVQLVYYSADDSNYEARSKIIDQSTRSLQEIKIDETHEEQEKEESSEPISESDSVTVKNDKVAFEIKGFRKVADQNEETLLVIRYEMTNLAEEKISADSLKEVVAVKQKEQLLTETILPENERNSALGLLEQHQKDQLEKEESVETVLVYKLKQTTGDVILTFNTEDFPNQDPVILDLDLLK